MKVLWPEDRQRQTFLSTDADKVFLKVIDGRIGHLNTSLSAVEDLSRATERTNQEFTLRDCRCVNDWNTPEVLSIIHGWIRPDLTACGILEDFDIQPLLPNKSRGALRVDDRRVINGILRRFRTGSPWADVLDR